MMPGRFTFDVNAGGYARWWSPQAVEKHQKKDLGRTTTALEAPLAPHDVVLVKLSPAG